MDRSYGYNVGDHHGDHLQCLRGRHSLRGRRSRIRLPDDLGRVAGVNHEVTDNLLGLVRYQGGLFGAETDASTAARALRAYAGALV